MTKREQEIMEHICQGADQDTIATKLQIVPATVDKPWKGMGDKSSVYCERDIPLAAYRAHLFSVLD